MTISQDTIDALRSAWRQLEVARVKLIWDAPVDVAIADAVLMLMDARAALARELVRLGDPACSVAEQALEPARG